MCVCVSAKASGLWYIVVLLAKEEGLDGNGSEGVVQKAFLSGDLPATYWSSA